MLQQTIIVPTNNGGRGDDVYENVKIEKMRQFRNLTKQNAAFLVKTHKEELTENLENHMGRKTTQPMKNKTAEKNLKQLLINLKTKN